MQNIVKPLKRFDFSVFSKYLNKDLNNKQSIRYLNLLECDSKKLLGNFGINIQNFITLDENDLKNGIPNLNFKSDKYVIKAQILSGGRGLGVFDNGFKSGVHIVDEEVNIENILKNMIGHRLVTKQTPKSGALVKKVTIAKHMNIQRELYFCILLDSSHGGPILMVSPFGGIDIEETFKNNIDAIKIFPIDITTGVTNELSSEVSKFLDLNDELHNKISKQITALWNAFVKTDSTQIEINPFAVTTENELVAIDAKIHFDDNALFRQNDITKLQAGSNEETDEREIKASEHNLNYVALDGNIGCLVNGAGLAMATMDIIKLYGGKPANFLDVGGGVTENQVFEAMKILLSDKNVKSILINIFGGIVDCTIIAKGVIRAMNELEISIPLTIRLEGNNVDKAKEMLSEFDDNLKCSFAEDLHEAAQLAVNF